MIDQNATKANFLHFFGDIEASARYVDMRYQGLDKKSFPWISVIIGGLLCLTLIAIPAGLVFLFMGFRGRRSGREKYITEAQNFTALATRVALANTNLDSSAMAPALAVGSFETPSPELDALCGELAEKLAKLYLDGIDDEADKALAKLVENDRARVNRRQRIPAQYTNGHEIFAFDLMIEKSVIDLNDDPPTVVVIGPSGAFGGIETIPVDCVVNSKP